jgi:hypothetical protein
MIHEEICTCEVAKLAKEKGFPQDVFGTCEMKSSCYLEDGRYYKDGCIYPIENAYTAPTQSLLQRWLREKKNIHIEIIATASGYYWCVNKTNGTSITDSDVLDRGTNDGGCFDTFELALEDALKYTLENLV